MDGLPIADEVIDIFLPILDFALQKPQLPRLRCLGPFDDQAAKQVTMKPVALA
jgi:hypothetical protein